MFAIGGSAKLKRTVKPKPESWACVCTDRSLGQWLNADGEKLRRLQAAHMSRCADCGARRP